MSRSQPEHGMRLVSLADSVHWLQAPPAGLRSLEELRQVAGARCAFLHGGSAADWVMQADWDARQPFLCAAMRREDAPQGDWQTVLQALRPAAAVDGWHAVQEADHVALWHVRRGHVDAIATFALAPGADADAAAAGRMQLAAVNQPGLEPGALRWHPPPRAAVPARRTALAWGAGAIAALALAAALLFAWQAAEAHSQLAAARSELQASQRRSAAPEAHANAASAMSASSSVLPNTADRQAWNRIARQLNTPWPQLLDALEAATPEAIALVAVEPDARQSAVRIRAEAKSLDELLAYAQALAAVALFARVDLLKHETNEQDPNKPVRLALEVRLRPQEAAR